MRRPAVCFVTVSWVALVLCGLGGLDAQPLTQSVDVNGDPLPKGALARLGSLRFRHDNFITSQAASPDGKWIASGGGRTVRVWDAATGKQVFLFPVSAGNRSIAPSVLAFSADSKRLAALGSISQGVVTVWDLQQGQQRYQVMLPQRDDNVGGGRSGQPEDLPLLAFTGNTAVAVKNFGDRVVRLFDLESGQEVRTFQDPGNLLTAATCSPDGSLLAAGSDSRHVVLWEVSTGKELCRLPHDYNLVSLAFSPAGRTLATLDQDLSPMLWDVKTGKQQLVLPARTRTVGIAFTHDGRSLLVARQPDEILSWDLETKKESRARLPKNWVLTPLSWMTTPMTKSGQGVDRLLLGASGRRGTSAKVRLAELTRDGPKPPAFDGYENGSVYAFYLSALKQWATIGLLGDDTVRLWDARGRVARSFVLPLVEQNVTTYAVAPDGKHFCLGGRDGRLYVADASEGKLAWQVQAFQKSCSDSAITADGRHLVANDLRTAKVFDLATGREMKSYEVHPFDSMRAIYSADGARLAAMVYNQDDEQPLLRVLDAATGAPLTENRVTVQQNTFYFSGDGRNLIFISNNRGRNGHMHVLETATGKTRIQNDLPTPFLYVGGHARISPDGRWLITTASGPEAEQYAAVAWRLGGTTEPIVLQGHRGSLASVNYSTDARQLLTVSYDSTLLVWDLAQFAKPATTPHRDLKELQALWAELGSTDAAKANAAVHQFADQPQAAPWLAEQVLKQAVSPDPEAVRELIDKLDSPKFSERQKATDALTRLGSAVTPLLREALVNDGSAEVKKRLQHVLEKAQESGGIGGVSLHNVRAIEALEFMGTPVALGVLNKMAARNDALGTEARWAGLRLRQRLGG